MARCVLPLRREAFPGTALALRISGLTGGHSGAEIHKERANANVLMGRLLSAADTEHRRQIRFAGFQNPQVQRGLHQAGDVPAHGLHTAGGAEAIHAGLECGLFCGKLPGLDCVSAGPDILEIHTPRERLSVPSVRRVWVFLLEVLRRLQ